MSKLTTKCLLCKSIALTQRGTLKCIHGGQRPVMVEYMLRTGDPCGPTQKLFAAAENIPAQMPAAPVSVRTIWGKP